MSEAAKSFSRTDVLRFRTADLADVEALVRLINVSFRVEQPFIEGDRVDTTGVRSYMAKGKFLLAEDSSGLAGCVYVELRGNRGLLGLARRGSFAAGNRPGPQNNGCCVPCHYILMSKTLR